MNSTGTNFIFSIILLYLKKKEKKILIIYKLSDVYHVIFYNLRHCFVHLKIKQL